MFLSRSSECTKLVAMDLAVLEDIRQLKYRYLRCVDQKLWDEMADVFTADATVDYGTRAYGKPLKLAGRDEILGFFRTALGPEIITVHAAGQPEITVDGDRASGTWRFEDTVIATEHRVVIAGAAYYQDRYERGADGAWRIAHTGYVRTYEAMMSLDDLPSFKFLAGVPKAPKTAPPTTEPSTTEPSTTEPSTTEPSTTGPSTTGPSTTGPSTTGTNVADPAVR
jgi:SnoaL-like domain